MHKLPHESNVRDLCIPHLGGNVSRARILFIDGIYLTLWSVLECYILIINACLKTLYNDERTIRFVLHRMYANTLTCDLVELTDTQCTNTADAITLIF